jgi:hypothetical protein
VEAAGQLRSSQAYIFAMVILFSRNKKRIWTGYTLSLTIVYTIYFILILGSVLDTNPGNETSMAGNDKGFAYFFMLWSMFLLTYGINAAMTTKKVTFFFTMNIKIELDKSSQ